MKLGAALSRLKSEKSQLARMIQIRKDTMYVKEGKRPAFDVKELTDRINEKIDDIRKLKIQIMRTNLETKADDITLAEAIVKVGDLRSKLANLSELIKLDRSDWLWGRKEKEVEYIPQVDEKIVEDEIKELEKEKVKLDNEIQKSNWTVDLIE